MSDPESRSRSADESTLKYRTPNDGQLRPKPPIERKPIVARRSTKTRKVSYDDYVEHVNNIEKIIDIDERTRWRQTVDYWDDYSEWSSVQRSKFRKWLAAHYINLRKKQPTVVESWQKLTRPLYKRYGARNVQFASISAIVGVLGLIVVNGLFFGASSAPIEVTDESQVLGGSSTQPNFAVVKPDNLTDETAIFFDPQLETASYVHEIDGTPVVISQQPLSDAQKQNRAAELSLIATTLSADFSFDSKFGRTFISSAALEDGSQASQVIIFMTEDLLIFIRNDSSVFLEPQSISDYISRIRI